MAVRNKTPPQIKRNATKNLNLSGGSGSSRRSVAKVKSMRESPVSGDDKEDSDSDGSAFGEDPDDSEGDADVKEDEDDEDEDEDDLASESEEDESEVEDNTKKRKASGKDKKVASNGNSVAVGGFKKQKTEKEEFDENGRIVTQLIVAPNTGHVPPGQISPHLMDFLSELTIPAHNDRDWFKARDAVFRYGWNNFCTFIDALVPDLIEHADETLPYLPAKDCVYMIYRDVRFSHDKTPYKTRLSATFKRGGRKSEDYGGYHLAVGPKGQSALYGGWHGPKSAILEKIRRAIIDDTPEGRKLKEIVNEKEFVDMFGEPKGGKGKGKAVTNERQNLWGGSDELKKGPKITGVEVKNHPEIEWLKLKSFWVEKKFTDEEVLSPDFRDIVCRAAKRMAPLVEHLNDFIHPPPRPPPPQN